MGYLVIRADDEIRRIFLDEINTVIIENPACCITGCLLAELTERKIKVIFCDEKHSPCAELLPCHGHSECAGRLREQILWDSGFCSRLWTRIVAEKIRNQARHLLELGKCAEMRLLSSYITELLPGDTGNREGHAAKVYFNAIFGSGFRRGDGTAIDSALNYGYALILSAFNRAVVACGFSTQLGIAHHNTFNYFNLSCDLMEPFRVLVDRWVRTCEFLRFESGEKHQVLEIFNQPFFINGFSRRLDDCIMIYTRSVFKAISERDISLVKFCSWQEGDIETDNNAAR